MNIRHVLLEAALLTPDEPPVDVWSHVAAVMSVGTYERHIMPDYQDVKLTYDVLSELGMGSGMSNKQYILAKLRGLALGEWKVLVMRQHPTAAFTAETGAGETYGDAGSTTAHTGPDMQDDVVGVYIPAGTESEGVYTPASRPEGFCWIGVDVQHEYPVRTESKPRHDPFKAQGIRG